MWFDTRILNLVVLFSFPYLVASITVNCDDIVIQGYRYDLTGLEVQTVHTTKRTPPSIADYEFTVNPCRALKWDDKVPEKYRCPHGTRICGVERISEEGTDANVTASVIPIAGEYIHHAKSLDPKWSRFQGSDSSADAKEDGISLEIGGGEYPFDSKNATPQKAFIEFYCDKDRTGNEGKEVNDKDNNENEKSTLPFSGSLMRPFEDEGDDENEPTSNPDEGKSIEFISYRKESDFQVLRLKWRTKYACEGQASSTPTRSKGRWGFFTWFIIILFLAVASYLIFGSWLNYNRYGARGLDLLPHGDTIRDIPYLLKDWARKVVNTFSGDSRGGYSAV